MRSIGGLTKRINNQLLPEPLIITVNVINNDVLNFTRAIIGNAIIDYGDGTKTSSKIHTYQNEGLYDIKITSYTEIGFKTKNSSSLNIQSKIVDIKQFGKVYLTEFNLGGCSVLQTTSTSDLIPSTITDYSYMFWGCINLVHFNNIELWNTTNTNSTIYMFMNTSFNQNINLWDVSNVLNMTSMFNLATSFNQPLNNWAVSNVTSMGHMFERASYFNQNISTWDVTSVINYTSFSLQCPLTSINTPNWV